MAGHKLFVAGSSELKLAATVMATATHAAGHVVFLETEDGKNFKDVRNDSVDAVKPKGRLENVDDVLHY